MSVEPVVDAELVRSADEWAEVIKADLGRAVEGIVAAGRNLIAAKADVRHGEWLPMLKQIGINRSDAQRYMVIGERFGDYPSLGNLPSSPSALIELSRLPAEDIEQGIESGAITSDMTIAQARDLVNPPAPEPEPAPATAECIHCGNTLPLEQLYEGGQGYECDPCIQPADSIEALADGDPELAGQLTEALTTDPTLPPLPENYMNGQVAQPKPAPEPRSVIGTDGKKYNPKPSTPQQPKRKPLPETFDRAKQDLRSVVERVARLIADDRLEKNKDQIVGANLSDLIRARDALTRVIQHLEG